MLLLASTLHACSRSLALHTLVPCTPAHMRAGLAPTCTCAGVLDGALGCALHASTHMHAGLAPTCTRARALDSALGSEDARPLRCVASACTLSSMVSFMTNLWQDASRQPCVSRESGAVQKRAHAPCRAHAQGEHAEGSSA